MPEYSGRWPLPTRLLQRQSVLLALLSNQAESNQRESNRTELLLFRTGHPSGQRPSPAWSPGPTLTAPRTIHQPALRLAVQSTEPQLNCRPEALSSAELNITVLFTVRPNS